MNIKSICTRKHFLDFLFFFGIIAPIFAIFSASRAFGTGADYGGYLEIFYGEANTEPAFRLLKIINKFFNKGTVTLAFIYFICAFTGLYLKGTFYKRYSNNFSLSILFYISTIFFLHEYTQIRAAIGLGICYLSVDEINKRQFKRFAIRILFAMCFHYSSVIMFFVYFYCNLFKNPKRYLQILWISFIGCLLLNKFLHGESLLIFLGTKFYFSFFFLGKLGALQNMSEFSVFNICYLGILILTTIYYQLFKGFSSKKSNDFTIFQLCSLSSIMFYSFFNFGFPVVTFRLSEFFIPFLFIVIPKIVSKFKEKFFLFPFIGVILFYYSRIFIKAVL